MNAAVFLDRDNTLIHNDGDLGDPEEVRLFQGAATAVASLCGLGYKVVVITNQGGVARGRYGEQDVDAVHERIRELIARGANGARIDRFYFCPYHPEGTVHAYKREHPNRKPQPGMLLEAARDLKLDLGQSWTIGDQMRDIEAGIAAGTRTILIHTDRQTPLPPTKARRSDPAIAPDFVARSLVEAVRIVAQQRKPDTHDPSRTSEYGPRRWDAAAVAQLQKQPPREPTPPAEPEEAPETPEPSEPVEAPEAPDTPDTPPPPETPPQEPDAEPAPPSSKAARPPRPFRPWSAPPSAEPDPPPQEPATEPVEASNGDRTAPHAEHDEQDDPDDATVSDRTLRLILQELRSQRGAGGEFSYLHVLAIVLQMVAAVCLLGALWMGAGNLDLFMRWMGAGLLIQGATIATLLFGRGQA